MESWIRIPFDLSREFLSRITLVHSVFVENLFIQYSFCPLILHPTYIYGSNMLDLYDIDEADEGDGEVAASA